MATFPIQYGQAAPPAASPNVTANVHTNDGTSELWQTIAGAGQNLTALGMGIANHIQDAANAIQLSTLKRKSDELLFAGYQEASQAPDDQTALKVWTAAHEKAANLGSGQNRLVADAYQIHLNNTLGQWNENLAVKRLAIQKENAFDAASLNYQAALEAGDFKSADDALTQQAKLAPNKAVEIVKANAVSLSRSVTPVDITDYVYALEHDGALLAVGGIKLMNPTTAWAWLDLTPHGLKRIKSTYRVIRDWLDVMVAEHGLYRLMAAVECDFPQAVRTVEHLGFVKESVMQNWTGDKPAYLYARLHTPQGSGTGMAGSYSPDLASDGSTEGVR